MTTPLDGTVITPMDLRAHAGEFLDRVRLQHDTFIIERRGTPMAALVPIERLRMMQETAASYSRLMSRLQAEHVAASGQDPAEIDEAAIEAVKRVRARAKQGTP
jgi:prevent-host-death family protein